MPECRILGWDALNSFSINLVGTNLRFQSKCYIAEPTIKWIAQKVWMLQSSFRKADPFTLLLADQFMPPSPLWTSSQKVGSRSAWKDLLPLLPNCAQISYTIIRAPETGTSCLQKLLGSSGLIPLLASLPRQKWLACPCLIVGRSSFVW